MKILVKTLSIAGAGLLLGGNLGAVVPEKYQTILDRNAFGLLPPPTPPDPNDKPPEPPANLKLTGFATIAGERRVYFTIPPDAKDPKGVQQYLSLSEGQREGNLEIITISESKEEVSVRNGSVDIVLSLKKDGFQPAKPAPGMNQAPMPMPLGAAPGVQAGSPVYSPASAGGVVANQAMQQAPGVPPNPQTPEQMNQQSGNVQPSSAPGAVRTIPTRTLRVPPIQQQSNPGPQSSVYNGNSVVYNPNPKSNYGSENSAPAVDPAVQLAAMREYQDMADRNGGYIPIEVPNRVANPVVAQPPSTTRYVPAPPLPPMPQ
ncbi:MAG: hypothetical protein H0X66_20235 [Verrucomicrobia bacterium]|nr:hypothetical protein [Verrucomicrobiota bacterium]